MLEHMETENRHEFDATIETFDHPRYELIATGEVYDGPRGGRRYFEETRTAFPDQRNEVIAVHHADDAVLRRGVGARHPSGLVPRPAADRALVGDALLAVFVFEEDRLLCERVYFDANTILRQLGIAHDPRLAAGRVSTVFNHPLTVGQAMVAPGHPPLSVLYFSSRERRRSLSTLPPVCSSGQ